MKILWITTFRSFGISKKNDAIQKKFLKDLENLNAQITLSVTIFNEVNIRKNIKSKKLKVSFFQNFKKLPHQSKYSQSICMENALKLFNNSYDYIIWSTADITIPKNFIQKISSFNHDGYLLTAFPIFFVTSKNKILKYSANWGLDLFILKLSSKNSIKKFKKLVKQCPNYGWGCYEHFFSSISEALNIKYINICKNLVIKKYNNDRNAFNDFRDHEIKSWKINQKYLIKYLKKNKLNVLYATGSMFYLIFKFFNFQELNLRSIIIYTKIIFKVPLSLIRRVFNNNK